MTSDILVLATRHKASVTVFGASSTGGPIIDVDTQASAAEHIKVLVTIKPIVLVDVYEAEAEDVTGFLSSSFANYIYYELHGAMRG